MRSVVTVLGKDRVGIIAEISNLLYDMNINIDGINQAIMEDLFTMVMLVDTQNTTVGYEHIQNGLKVVGTKLGVDIRIQREEIFQSMHRL